jgi:hypothetical protein
MKIVVSTIICLVLAPIIIVLGVVAILGRVANEILKIIETVLEIILDTE